MALPILPFEKLAKQSGAKRMAKEATEELRDIIEEYGFSTAENAVKLCTHAGRRTIKEEDVKFVD
jgi:DNA-binding protein